MLFFKAWRESRIRFLLSAAALAGMCGMFVYLQAEIKSQDGISGSYISYIWRFVYGGYMREFFLVMVLLLGVGGLLRERAYGTAVFTLVLPLHRWQIVAARAIVGVLEVAGLALVPAIIVPASSRVMGASYPISQALMFAVLWTVGGMAVFSMAFLFSATLAGEYSAPVASLVGLLAYSGLVQLPVFRKYPVDLHDIMSGAEMPYFDSNSSLLIGPFPWTVVTVVVLVGLCLLALSGIITRRRDF